MIADHVQDAFLPDWDLWSLWNSPDWEILHAEWSAAFELPSDLASRGDSPLIYSLAQNAAMAHAIKVSADRWRATVISGLAQDEQLDDQTQEHDVLRRAITRLRTHGPWPWPKQR